MPIVTPTKGNTISNSSRSLSTLNIPLLNKSSKANATIKQHMRHPKISIITSAIITGISAALMLLFLTFNSIGGYVLVIPFALLTLYWGHRLYTKLWLYNWGKPLSEEKKHRREQLRSQVRACGRFNLYHVWYRFADATEEEYQAKKNQKALRKLKRK